MPSVTKTQPAPLAAARDSAALASLAGTLFTKWTNRCGEFAGIQAGGV